MNDAINRFRHVLGGAQRSKHARGTFRLLHSNQSNYELASYASTSAETRLVPDGMLDTFYQSYPYSNVVFSF